MNKQNYVLKSSIPAGGRHLTNTECKKLREVGIKCSERYWVMPYAADINYGGPLYRPCKTGGLDNTGIIVE